MRPCTLIGLFFLLCPAVYAGSDRVVWLQQKQSVCVQDDSSIRLGDLIVNSLDKNISSLSVSDDIVVRGEISRSSLARWLETQELPRHRMTGAKRTRVCKLSLHSERTAYEAAADALRGELSELAPGVLIVGTEREYPAELLLPKGATYLVGALRINRTVNHAQVELLVIYEGKTFRTFIYQFSLSDPASKVYAAVEVEAGGVIDETMLSGAAEKKALYLGRRATIPIARGGTVDESNTRVQLAVERDMPVSVNVSHGSVTLNLNANALQSGNVGQRVRLYSRNLNVEFNAVVSGVGKAYVPL